MKLSYLTLTILALNAVVDTGKYQTISADEVEDRIYLFRGGTEALCHGVSFSPSGVRRVGGREGGMKRKSYNECGGSLSQLRSSG